MDDVLSKLVARLEEYGLGVEARPLREIHDVGYDVDVELSRGRARQAFAMQLKTRPTLSNIDRIRPAVPGPILPLIGATSVAPRTADAFRRAGIQFIDSGGNASIHFDDVLIDVRGRRTDRDQSRPQQKKGGNLFSRARAQVAFVLLQWPSLWGVPQRELAEAAGVSLGQANDAVTMFRNSGFGPGGHRSDAEFLDLWVAAFPTGLASKLTLAIYRGSLEEFGKASAEDPALGAGSAVSGEVAAVDLLRPAALTIYVGELDPMLPLRNRWRTDGKGNITVRRKFWTTPSGETHDDEAPLIDQRLAPALLVYADLMASDDPRVRGVAPEWRRRIAGLQFDH